MISSENHLNICEASLKDAESIQLLLEQLGYTLKVEEVSRQIAAFARTGHKVFITKTHERIVGVISIELYGQLVLVVE
jgi:hypothetical protein